MSLLYSYNAKYHWKCSVPGAAFNNLSLISLRNVIRFYVERSLLKHGCVQKYTTAIAFLHLVQKFLEKFSLSNLIRNAELTPLVERGHFFMSRDFMIPGCHYRNCRGLLLIAHLPNPILQ